MEKINQYLKEITPEQKNKIFETKVEMNIFLIYQLMDIINLSSKRGAFNPDEFIFIGEIFNSLNTAMLKSISNEQNSQVPSTSTATTATTTATTSTSTVLLDS